MKTCPQCKALVHDRTEQCPACDLRLVPRRFTWVWVTLAVAAVAVTGWLLLH